MPALNPAPAKDAPGAPSWLRWFNGLYAAFNSLAATVSTILSGGTLANATLTSPTLSNATLTGASLSATTLSGGTTVNGDVALNGVGVTITSSSGRIAFTTPDKVDFGSNWQTFTPTITASGSMTTSSLALNDAQWIRIGPIVHYRLYFGITLGGTASNIVYATFPTSLPGYAGGSIQLQSVAVWTGAFSAGFGYMQASGSQAQLVLGQSGQANFPLSSVVFLISGSYRCA